METSNHELLAEHIYCLVVLERYTGETWVSGCLTVWCALAYRA